MRHPAEIAARQLHLPSLLLPLICDAARLARDALQSRIASLNCMHSKIVCSEMCSVCLWRHAHVASLRLVEPAETSAALTARRVSPEFNTTILMERDIHSMVIQAVMHTPCELSSMTALYRNALLIRRQAAPSPVLAPVFRYALLAAVARFALPVDLAARPDVIARLAALNRRIFYLLALFLLEDVSRRAICPFDPALRVPGFNQRIQAVLTVLPRALTEFIETDALSTRTKSDINSVSYVRQFCDPPVCKIMEDRSVPDGLRVRVTAFHPAAAVQATAVRCCGRLPINVPMHPQTAALVDRMCRWSVRPRLAGEPFSDLSTRFICMACMTVNPKLAFDARGFMYCMQCDQSNVVWVNPMHLVLTVASDAQPRVERPDGARCVVGRHTIRSADTCFATLGRHLICDEHLKSRAWLASVAQEHQQTTAALLMSTNVRSASSSAWQRK